MCVDQLSDDHDSHSTCQPCVEESPAAATGNAIAQLVKAETNFLRLPLFALHTKRLQTLDGIECRGRTTRDGQTYEYVLRITRNTASLYPGPLCRRMHFAFLAIATERGFPMQNPITWTWRDLCRRMDIAYGGHTTIRQLKAAVRSTHGIVLHTEHALFSRSTGQPLPSTERGYHLYSDYIFRNDPRPDGSTADTNAVWFADWYLENLNGLYSAPVDYDLWQSLDHKSPIASRLYEFLLFHFYSTPLVRINYPNLAQLLPIRPERYLSDAKRQMESAFELLSSAGVIASAEWLQSKHGSLQLHFRRGHRLALSARRNSSSQDTFQHEPDHSVAVNELRNLKAPEYGLVREFYKLWSGDGQVRPTPNELAHRWRSSQRARPHQSEVAAAAHREASQGRVARG